jgi:hypothetical protein
MCHVILDVLTNVSEEPIASTYPKDGSTMLIPTILHDV